jgi:hypothetical protein
MTDQQDENRQNDEQSSMKRRRARIYADRRTVSLRLDPELHQRMMNLCDDLQTPANSYISGLIEGDLKKRKR